MKKNKGFTLAELLVIIVIVGLLIGLTGYTVTRVMKQSRENIKEENLKNLMDTGKMYLNQVIDGNDTYKFSDGDYTGYKFLTNLAENCGNYSKKVCDYTKKDTTNNKYTVKLEFTISTLKDYVNLNEYGDDSKCGMYAYINISKNDKGYYIFEGLDVKPSDTTKASTCIITE